MRIQRQSVGRLTSLMLALSLLLGMVLTGCSDKDTSYYCCGGNGNGQGGGGDDYLNRRHKIYYQFRQKTAAKAVEAGATHVAGFAYDDRANRDSEFSIAETEIAKMKKAKNGDYMAELDVSGRVTHIDLYFYYDEGKEKLATNCKYVPIDFASLLKEDKEIIIIDSNANDAYFTIKTYDGSGKETGRFASGDKVYAKVFVTCEGDESFYVPFPSPGSVNEDRTFTLGELVSDAADVVDNSTEKNDEYKVLKALAEGTANLYVYNLGFTCLFSEHEVNVGPAEPDFTALYLAPAGYKVSRDGTEILDPNGNSVKPSSLPKEQEIAAGDNYTFVAIGAKKTASGTVYELMGNKADAVLTTDSQNINNDGFKVSVAAGATEADKASIGAVYGDLTSKTVKIKVTAQPAYTALYLAPAGYTVSRDGSEILDPDGNEVAPSELPKEQAIVAGGDHTFVAIAAKEGDAGVTYELMGNKADALLTTASRNITNKGFKVSVAAGATAADVASIQAALDTLISNKINITVEPPITFTALYLAPQGYTVSRDGSQILDPDGAEVAPDDLPAELVMDNGSQQTFVAIGAKNDGTSVTYELIGEQAEAVFISASKSITNDGFKVSVAAGAAADDAAAIRAAFENLNSNIVNIAVRVNYTALYLAPEGYTVSADGTAILDPDDAEVDPADLPAELVMVNGTRQTFVAIAARDGDAGVIYEMFGSQAEAVLTTESASITNSGFKVSVAAGASADDTAAIKATFEDLTSNIVNITVRIRYTALYLAPEGYTVSADGSQILDPDGAEVDPADLPAEQVMANGSQQTFAAISARNGDAGIIYVLVSDQAEAVLTTESASITNDGLKVSVAAGAAADDKAAVKATFENLTSNIVNIAVKVNYTALYLAPEGYTVSDDGTKILDPDGAEVAPADLPAEQVMANGSQQTFAAIGVRDGDAGVIYVLFSDKAEAVLTTESANITNNGFKVSVAAGASADDKATINATFENLTSNVVNITVKVNYTTLYLAPEGYTVSADDSQILDPTGAEVDPADLPAQQVMASGSEQTFAAISARNGDAGVIYVLVSDQAEAVLTTESAKITNDGFKVSIAAGATADDKATIKATFENLTSNTVNITVKVNYTALYLAPEGYKVSDDGTKILDPDGAEVSPADLPEEQVIDAGGNHTFVAIGARDGGSGVIYELVSDQAEAVLTTESANITNDGFKVSAAAGATAADKATVKAVYDDLTSNVVNITVTVPTDKYLAIYVVPYNYVASDDGKQILDWNYDEPIEPEDLPNSKTIERGTSYPFGAIGVVPDPDNPGGVLYKDIYNAYSGERDYDVDFVLTTASAKITNSADRPYKVSVDRTASEEDTATLKAVCGSVESNAMAIQAVPYRSLWLCDGTLALSDDGSKLYDPDYPEDEDTTFYYEDMVDDMGPNVGWAYPKGTDVPFKVYAIDTTQEKILPISVKVNPADDGAEIIITGDHPECLTLKLAESAVHVNEDAISGAECYLHAVYRGMESNPDRFIITVN